MCLFVSSRKKKAYVVSIQEQVRFFVVNERSKLSCDASVMTTR